VLAYFGTPKPADYAKDIVNSVHPGSIVLMHDGYGILHDIDKADKSLAVKALPIIIAQLKAKGYRFVTVPEMLGVNAYNKAP
jgi:peptidoglycan-N-acetylglucosamine deacetylase